MANDFNRILSARISELRRGSGLTQEALAERLGVSFQAVSKWENALSCPDITLLPLIADIFSVSIDSLFGRESAAKSNLPWNNDKTIRAVAFVGTTLISSAELKDEKKQLTLRIEGDALDVISDFSVSCNDVHGDVAVKGNAKEACVSCARIEGHLSVLGGSVSCDDIEGDVTIKGDATSTLTCDNIEGDLSIVCAVVTAGNIEGDVRIAGNKGTDTTLVCDDIEGDVTVRSAMLTCDRIGGDVNVSGEPATAKDVGIVADKIDGDVTLTGGMINVDRILGDVSVSANAPAVLTTASEDEP